MTMWPRGNSVIEKEWEEEIHIEGVIIVTSPSLITTVMNPGQLHRIVLWFVMLLHWLS